MSEYLVIYEQAEDGEWGAYLPNVPGVVALGATREEVTAGIEEALAAYAEISPNAVSHCRRPTTWPGP